MPFSNSQKPKVAVTKRCSDILCSYPALCSDGRITIKKPKWVQCFHILTAVQSTTGDRVNAYSKCFTALCFLYTSVFKDCLWHHKWQLLDLSQIPQRQILQRQTQAQNALLLMRFPLRWIHCQSSTELNTKQHPNIHMSHLSQGSCFLFSQLPHLFYSLNLILHTMREAHTLTLQICDHLSLSLFPYWGILNSAAQL